ncbi:MAG: LysR family transcriptional regulator [Clostridia bacterium]
MQLREQECIIAIAECKSITSAAKQLYLTQPALSIFLSNLEKSLGAQLFDRSKNTLTLTKVGKLYVEKARQMLQLRNEFDCELARIVEQHYGSLCIGIQALRAPRLIPKLLIGFHDAYSNIGLSFEIGVTDELDSMLAERKVNLVLKNRSVIEPKIEYTPLREDTLLLVAPAKRDIPFTPSTADDSYGIVDLNDFINEHFFLNESSHCLRRNVNSLMQRHGLSFSCIKEVSRQESALHMAAFGYGLTFTLDSYLHLFSLPKPVKYYRVAQQTEPIYYDMVCHHNTFSPKFKNQLLKVLKNICT